MCSRAKADQIIHQMSQSVRTLFPDSSLEVILYGSYARHEETDESDIDVMYLVDVPRSIIAERNWQLGEAAANLLMEHGVMISPIVENREYFMEKSDALPFFRNIQQEGVRVSA